MLAVTPVGPSSVTAGLPLVAGSAARSVIPAHSGRPESGTGRARSPTAGRGSGSAGRLRPSTQVATSAAKVGASSGTKWLEPS